MNTSVLIIILSALLLIQLFFLTRRMRFFLLSPIYSYVYFLIGSLILVIVYRFLVADDQKIDLFSFNLLTRQDNFLSTLNYYLLALNAFLLGTTFHYLLTRNVHLYREKIHFWGLGAGISRRNPVRKVTLVFVSFFLFFVTQALLFLAYKGSGVFYRSEYIPSNLVVGYSTANLIVNIMLIVVLSQIHRYSGNLSGLLFALTILSTLSTGSRKVLIYILLYAILLYVQSKRDLRANVNFFLLIVLSVVLLLYTMQLRALPQHGLIPYLRFLPDSIKNFGDQLYFVIYYLFIYGFFAAVQTQNSAIINWSTTLIALNPFTGNLAGWYDIADQMRLNLYAPFSLYGEIFSIGWGVTFVYFLTIGYLFGLFENYIRRFYSQGKYLSGHVIYLLAVMFTIYAYEYNLRSGTRYIYYAILWIIFQLAFSKLSRKRT